jgi:hypothetical protein
MQYDIQQEMKAASVPLTGLATPLSCVEDELHPIEHPTEISQTEIFFVFVPELEQVPD